MLDRPDNLPMFIATVWTRNATNGQDRESYSDTQDRESYSVGDEYADDVVVTFDRRIERGRALSADDFRRELLADSADDEITVGPVSLSKHQ